jgi:hypothetical protein
MFLTKQDGPRADYHSPDSIGALAYNSAYNAEGGLDFPKLNVGGKAYESGTTWNGDMDTRSHTSALATEWFAPPAPNGSECPMCFDFETITVGGLESALDTLYFAGRISLEELADIADRYEACCPGLTADEREASPAGISYEALQADIYRSHARGNCEERNKLLRILQLLYQFDAGLKKLTVAA